MLLICIAVFAAYAGVYKAPFVFDDVQSIVNNPSLHSLWPIQQALSPPSDSGVTVGGRPILNLSLALNYAVSGLNVGSYHALNLVIHLLAGLTLFGIVRRTLLRPSLAAQWGDRSVFVALAIAGLWLLHPLQTEAVTYIVQRAESLMGFFFLLTLYGFIRALDSPHPRAWTALSFFSCLLGAGTKEVAALAPLLVFLYDRTFAAGSFRAAWERHCWRHLSLAATWIPLGILLASTGGNRGGTIGFDIGVSWLGYWLTQFEAVTRYLWLSFWPYPQVFDYGIISAGPLTTTALWAVPVVSLFLVTLWALWKRPVAGFLGAWFFLLLAPTSVVPGKLQMIVEHRMYLPLAGVLTLALGAAAKRPTPRVFLSVSAALMLAAGFFTAHRNALYRNERILWEETLAARPGNARAHNNLGRYFSQRAQLDEAIHHYRESLRLDGSNPYTPYNLGLLLIKTGRVSDALAPLTEAVRRLPDSFGAQVNLGVALTALGRAPEALIHFATGIEHFKEEQRSAVSLAEAHFHFGIALASLERWSEAMEQYAAAVVANPSYAVAHSNWGVALGSVNDLPRALIHFYEALRLKPDLTEAHFNLALALSQLNRVDEALAHLSEATRLDPAHGEAEFYLGLLLAQNGKLKEGIVHLERAVGLRPNSSEARTNFALALLEAGRGDEAITQYEKALLLRPGDPRSCYNLGAALLAVGRKEEARSRFEAALRIDAGFAPAIEQLRRLRLNRPFP